MSIEHGKIARLRNPLEPVNRDALERSIAQLEKFEGAGTLLDEIENWPEFGESVMLCLHELNRLRASDKQVGELELDLVEARKLVAEQQVRIAKLTGALETQPPISLEAGSWFYPEGDTSSDECRFSVGEVIDYAAEGMAQGEKRVVVIERAVQLPDVYAAVHLLTEADKDARSSDDDVDFTLHATADAARAALSEKG